MHPGLAVQCLHQTSALLGEGPVWAEQEQALYWLDIHGKRIHRLSFPSGEYATWPTPFRIASLAPRASGGFIGGSERGFVLIDAEFRGFSIIGNPEPELPGNRFNDGKVDGCGRFWAGTMDDSETARTGSLYRLGPDMRWTPADTGYAVTNGPAFSPDGRICYHSDSADQTIFRFDLASSGDLGGKRVFARFGSGDGYPDGMTVDAEGCLWVAFWDGWCVRRLAPDGQVLTTVELPVQRPTSCVFGGLGLDTVFVTSASVGLGQEDLAKQPLAGGLFAFRPGVRGLAAPYFAA